MTLVQGRDKGGLLVRLGYHWNSCVAVEDADFRFALLAPAPHPLSLIRPLLHGPTLFLRPRFHVPALQPTMSTVLDKYSKRTNVFVSSRLALEHPHQTPKAHQVQTPTRHPPPAPDRTIAVAGPLHGILSLFGRRGRKQ